MNIIDKEYGKNKKNEDQNINTLDKKNNNMQNSLNLSDLNKAIVNTITFVSKRLLHDFFNGIHQISLTLGDDNIKNKTGLGSNEKINLNKIIGYLCSYRDIVSSLHGHESFFETGEKVVNDIKKMCEHKDILFVNASNKTDFLFLKKDMLNLLFFAIELMPVSIELMSNGVKLTMRSGLEKTGNIYIHSDFLQIMEEYEKEPGLFIEKLNKNLVTYKNFHFVLFHSYLFENGKIFSISRIGSLDIFLSIKDKSDQENKFLPYKFVTGVASLMSNPQYEIN